MKAHEFLMEATDLLAIMKGLRGDSNICSSTESSEHHSFIELGKVWQAPLYEIILKATWKGLERVVPVFNNLVVNEASDDMEAEFLNKKYILPRESCFYMVCSIDFVYLFKLANFSFVSVKFGIFR